MPFALILPSSFSRAFCCPRRHLDQKKGVPARNVVGMLRRRRRRRRKKKRRRRRRKLQGKEERWDDTLAAVVDAFTMTRHASHVTCHTSHVTRHAPHVTRHRAHLRLRRAEEGEAAEA